jgi:hypothetical protein
VQRNKYYPDDKVNMGYAWDPWPQFRRLNFRAAASMSEMPRCAGESVTLGSHILENKIPQK